MTRVTFLRDTETITASQVCRYSVNHFTVSFVKVLFLDNPSNFY